MPVYVQRPDGKLYYQYEWAAAVPAGVTLVSVSNIVPSPLVIESAVLDADAKTSAVLLSGAQHGVTYLIKALAMLSNNEEVPGEATIRGFDA